MNKNNTIMAARLATTHVDSSNAKAGVQLMAKLIQERTQFSVAPDDAGWTISYITHDQLEDQPGAA